MKGVKLESNERGDKLDGNLDGVKSTDDGLNKLRRLLSIVHKLTLSEQEPSKSKFVASTTLPIQKLHH